MKKMQIDRFEEDIAVLLCGDERALDIPRSAFPFAVKEGDILEIEWDGEVLLSARLLEEETAAQKERIHSLMEKIKNRRKKD